MGLSPTPWRISNCHILDADRCVVPVDNPENARLIANAPTAHQLVREALQAFTDDLRGMVDHPSIDIYDWTKSARAYLEAVEGPHGTR